MSNQFPKLHNAMWPGLVGKGPDSEPPIDLDTMLDLTQAAEIDGIKFDGVDLFLASPHTDIDSTPDDIKRLADNIGNRGFAVGSLVAPVWSGSAMGSPEARANFITQVSKACAIGKQLRKQGIRKYGVVRIDSSCSVADWAADPQANSKIIAETFREACVIAEDYGERLAAEGEICWGGMHSWRHMVELLEMVDRPKVLGFQADMAHTLLYTLGGDAPEDDALAKVIEALGPWTIDFHVAQSDATVKGSGSHEKTGRHCLPDDPNGKLDIPRVARMWLERAQPLEHICWDGCMFPNATLLNPATWNSILKAMITVPGAANVSERA